MSRGQRVTALLALVIGGGMLYLYAAYLRGGDVSPDSPYGYSFAIAGTLLLFAVGIGYALRKRLRRNWSGLLHAALNWHVVGGMLALAFILMHAVGNFHPRTGTYALYSLIALVISGMIGKLLDRLSPRLAAKAALRTLNTDGEERLESLVGVLSGKHRVVPRKRLPTFRRPGKAGVPWDLAYYDLTAEPDEIPALLNRHGRGGSHRSTSQHESSTSSLAAGELAKDAMASESAAIREAIGVERFYLSLIRVWRYLHTAISVVTLVLILWHLEFAATLLLGAK